MKKILLSILGLMTLTAVHAQQTVVVERPGIFTDLADAATALVTLPVAAVSGIVVGTVEGVKEIVTGSTTVIAAPAPVVVAPRTVTQAPVVVAPQAAAPAPVVVAPRTAVPSTTIITQYEDGSVTAVTRQASAYELGPNVLVPVDPSHRVGTSPYVNPYVFRYR